MIKYIIFDFDGTLVDSKEVVLSVYNELAQKHRFKNMKLEDVESFRRLSFSERFKALGLPIYKIPFWTREFYSLYNERVKDLTMFKDMIDVLNELNDRGYKIAIISSNAKDNIKEFLHKHKIDYIKQILCSEKLAGKDKVIKEFLRTNKLNNLEIIYIGDEARDIVACKKNGVKVIWVEWGLDIIEMVKHECPEYIAHRPKDILEIINS